MLDYSKVSVSLSFLNKVTKTGLLISDRNLLLIITDVGNLKSRAQPDWVWCWLFSGMWTLDFLMYSHIVERAFFCSLSLLFSSFLFVSPRSLFCRLNLRHQIYQRGTPFMQYIPSPNFTFYVELPILALNLICSPGRYGHVAFYPHPSKQHE